MHLIATLAAVFAKIGLFTLGGGLAVIALVRQEMLARGWLNQSEFLDILGVAQVTPGAMGVNTATFVGWRVAENAFGSWALSLAAALAASIAVVAPSVVAVVVFGGWIDRNRTRPLVAEIFAVLRPVVSGAVFAVGVNLVLEVFGAPGILEAAAARPSLRTVAIAALACFLTVRKKPKKPKSTPKNA